MDRGKQMDFAAALEGYWLSRRRDLSSHTVADYRLTFSRFATHVKHTPLDQISSNDIHHFLNDLRTRRKLSAKTVANAWTALSSFFTWAELELKLVHPIRGVVRRPEWRKPEIRPYVKAEVLALLTATETTAAWRSTQGKRTASTRPTALRDRTILVTLLDTGLRASELCALVYGDYEPEAGRIIVRHGKGDKRRTVYLGQAAQRQLWRYLSSCQAIRSIDPLFTTRVGTALTRGQLFKMIAATGKRAGVVDANVHRFRHTFAISFLRNGGNVLELQRLLGHERMDTLRIYVELAQFDLANAQTRASPADNWGL